jgi:hypothetical protein
MNLATPYMGLQLAHPLMPGASPLVDNMDPRAPARRTPAPARS